MAAPAGETSETVRLQGALKTALRELRAARQSEQSRRGAGDTGELLALIDQTTDKLEAERRSSAEARRKLEEAERESNRLQKRVETLVKEKAQARLSELRGQRTGNVPAKPGPMRSAAVQVEDDETAAFVTQLMEDNASLQSQLGSFRSEMERLKKEVKQQGKGAAKRVREVEAKNGDLSRALHSAEVEAKEAQAVRERTLQELRATIREKAASEKRQKTAQAEAERQGKELEKLRQRLHVLRSQGTRVEAQAEELEEQSKLLTRLTTALEQCEARTQRLRQSVDAERVERKRVEDAAQSRIAEVRDGLPKLEARVERAEEEARVAARRTQLARSAASRALRQTKAVEAKHAAAVCALQRAYTQLDDVEGAVATIAHALAATGAGSEAWGADAPIDALRRCLEDGIAASSSDDGQRGDALSLDSPQGTDPSPLTFPGPSPTAARQRTKQKTGAELGSDLSGSEESPRPAPTPHAATKVYQQPYTPPRTAPSGSRARSQVPTPAQLRPRSAQAGIRHLSQSHLPQRPRPSTATTPGATGGDEWAKPAAGDVLEEEVGSVTDEEGQANGHREPPSSGLQLSRSTRGREREIVARARRVLQAAGDAAVPQGELKKGEQASAEGSDYGTPTERELDSEPEPEDRDVVPGMRARPATAPTGGRARRAQRGGGKKADRDGSCSDEEDAGEALEEASPEGTSATPGVVDNGDGDSGADEEVSDTSLQELAAEQGKARLLRRRPPRALAGRPVYSIEHQRQAHHGSPPPASGASTLRDSPNGTSQPSSAQRGRGSVSAAPDGATSSASLSHRLGLDTFQQQLDAAAKRTADDEAQWALALSVVKANHEAALIGGVYEEELELEEEEEEVGAMEAAVPPPVGHHGTLSATLKLPLSPPLGASEEEGSPGDASARETVQSDVAAPRSPNMNSGTAGSLAGGAHAPSSASNTAADSGFSPLSSTALASAALVDDDIEAARERAQSTTSWVYLALQGTDKEKGSARASSGSAPPAAKESQQRPTASKGKAGARARPRAATGGAARAPGNAGAAPVASTAAASSAGKQGAEEHAQTRRTRSSPDGVVARAMAALERMQRNLREEESEEEAKALARRIAQESSRMIAARSPGSRCSGSSSPPRERDEVLQLSPGRGHARAGASTTPGREGRQGGVDVTALIESMEATISGLKSLDQGELLELEARVAVRDAESHEGSAQSPTPRRESPEPHDVSPTPLPRLAAPQTRRLERRGADASPSSRAHLRPRSAPPARPRPNDLDLGSTKDVQWPRGATPRGAGGIISPSSGLASVRQAMARLVRQAESPVARGVSRPRQPREASQPDPPLSATSRSRQASSTTTPNVAYHYPAKRHSGVRSTGRSRPGEMGDGGLDTWSGTASEHGHSVVSALSRRRSWSASRLRPRSRSQSYVSQPGGIVTEGGDDAAPRASARAMQFRVRTSRDPLEEVARSARSDATARVSPALVAASMRSRRVGDAAIAGTARALAEDAPALVREEDRRGSRGAFTIANGGYISVRRPPWQPPLGSAVVDRLVRARRERERSRSAGRMRPVASEKVAKEEWPPASGLRRLETEGAEGAVLPAWTRTAAGRGESRGSGRRGGWDSQQGGRLRMSALDTERDSRAAPTTRRAQSRPPARRHSSASSGGGAAAPNPWRGHIAPRVVNVTLAPGSTTPTEGSMHDAEYPDQSSQPPWARRTGGAVPVGQLRSYRDIARVRGALRSQVLGTTGWGEGELTDAAGPTPPTVASPLVDALGGFVPGRRERYARHIAREFHQDDELLLLARKEAEARARGVPRRAAPSAERERMLLARNGGRQGAAPAPAPARGRGRGRGRERGGRAERGRGRGRERGQGRGRGRGTSRAPVPSARSGSERPPVPRKRGGSAAAKQTAIRRSASSKPSAADGAAKRSVGNGAPPAPATATTEPYAAAPSGDDESEASEAGTWWWAGAQADEGKKQRGGREAGAVKKSRAAPAEEGSRVPAPEPEAREAEPLSALSEREPRGQDLAAQISAELDAMAEQFPEMLRSEAAHWV